MLGINIDVNGCFFQFTFSQQEIDAYNIVKALFDDGDYFTWYIVISNIISHAHDKH